MFNGYWQELLAHWHAAGAGLIALKDKIPPTRVIESVVIALIVAAVTSIAATTVVSARLDERIIALEKQRLQQVANRDKQLIELSERMERSDAELRKQISEMRQEIGAIYKWVNERKR